MRRPAGVHQLADAINMQYKTYKHNPPHLYADNSSYAITSAIYREIKFFNTNSQKEMLLEIIKEILSFYKYGLQGWAILDNHYHILTKSNIGSDLPTIIRKIHSKSAVQLKKYALASQCTPIISGVH